MWNSHRVDEEGNKVWTVKKRLNKKMGNKVFSVLVLEIKNLYTL